MKIALIQTNPIIGDFDYNCANILDGARKAQDMGCSLAIFPEMSVSGYPPQDLLERSAFVMQQHRAVETLVSELPEIDVLFGCFEHREGGSGKKLYNSAVVARSGKIVFRAHKQLLPSYDVFDETRYFEPGDVPAIFEHGGLRFGVTICEDIWRREVSDYNSDPVNLLLTKAKQENTRLDALINISASPFQRHKEQQKQLMFREISISHQIPLIYVNQVGGQDSLIFDGRSLVMNEKGEVTAKGKGFATGITVIDSCTWTGELAGKILDDEVEAIFRSLVIGVQDYVRKCGFSQVVLGLSGGIDSALTAAIAVEALGPENVMGIALPSPYSSPDSEEDARMLAESLGCRYEVIPISSLFAGFKKSLSPLFGSLAEDITEQNIQARIRGNLLMALSNKFGSLLLTTGNKSEMAVGYCTLYGDMSGGLAVISDVPKQLVYELARFVNRDSIKIPLRTISKAPTAELKPDQRDQDDLPPYEILDQILQMHLEEGQSLEAIVSKGFEEKLVRDVLRRIRVNEYKRKQAPLGLKVTSKAFGYGRRYPNVQNFQE